MGYRQLDHTADLAIEVSATTRDELFAEALAAFTDCVTEVGRVAPRQSSTVEIEAPALDELLLEWLQQAVVRFEVDGVLASRAEVRVTGDRPRFRLRAEVSGEEWDGARHPLKVLIKGVTYHHLRVSGRAGAWSATVVFDI